MQLSDSLVKAFARAVDDTPNPKDRGENTVYATARVTDDGIFVQLDASDVLTPAANSVNVSDGDRVLVLLKNRSAVIVGNLTEKPLTSAQGDERYLSLMTGASSSADGTAGLVPAPSAGDVTTRFLRSDGIWTYPKALHTNAARPASADLNIHDSYLRYFLATSSMTTGKPDHDGHILHMAWDTTAWDSQLAVLNTNHIQTRTCRSGNGVTVWTDWVTMLDTDNYASYVVPKTGGIFTGNVSVRTTDANAQVFAYCEDTKVGCYLHSDTNGVQGVWSAGYWDGSKYVSSSKRLVYRDTNGDVYCSGRSALDVPLTGNATLTGWLRYKDERLDLSKTNNNVSETTYSPLYDVRDTGLRIHSRIEAVTHANGNTTTQWYVRNYDTDGNQVAQKVIAMTLTKSGNVTYTVSDPAKFTSAINALPLTGGTLTGGLTATYFKVGSSTYNATNIELYGNTVPSIDFHYNQSTADYTTRLGAVSTNQLRVWVPDDASSGTVFSVYMNAAKDVRSHVQNSLNNGSLLASSSGNFGVYQYLSGKSGWLIRSDTTGKVTVSTTVSDIRLKDNVKDTDEANALALINRIKMRQFDWKATGEHQAIGFVADELEALDPHLAFGGGEDEFGNMDKKNVDTFYLLGYLVKAVQELSGKVEEPR